MSDKESKGHGNLTYYIIGAIIAAIATGYFAPEIAVKFDVGGEVFLNLLMMMVVPLVVMSVMSGILGLGDVRKLGKPGAYAVGYYMCTTVLAVIVGLQKMQPSLVMLLWELSAACGTTLYYEAMFIILRSVTG